MVSIRMQHTHALTHVQTQVKSDKSWLRVRTFLDCKYIAVSPGAEEAHFWWSALVQQASKAQNLSYAHHLLPPQIERFH